jgi:hypothetical protein
MGIIDADAMYRAGFGRASTGRNPAAEAHNALVEAAYETIGTMAIGSIKSGFKNLQRFKNLSDSQTSLLNLKVDKLPKGNEDLKASILEIKKRYDKAARNASLGIGKMRSKGRQDMTSYMQQLTDMSAELEVYKTNAEAAQGMATVKAGIAGENNQAGNKNINPAATPMEVNNTLEQANGLMGLNLRWDVDNPGLMVQRGGVWGVDENGKDVYTPKVSVTGTYEEYAKEFKGMKDKSGEDVAPMSKEEWKEANRKNTIRLAKYSDIRYAGEEDNIFESDIKQVRAALVNDAWNSNAKPWDLASGIYKDNFLGKVDSYSEDQFKDFYFGGFSYDFSTNRMGESAPAYIKLKSEDIVLGHTNEDGSFKPGFGPGSADWERRLVILKEQRFVKGSKIRTEVANQVWSGMEQQYKDTNDRYKRDNPDKSGIGLNIVGGQQIPTATWNKVYAPYIDFLNNPVEGKRMNSPRGGITEYKDGEWYFQGEKSTLTNIADTDYITNYVPGAQVSQIEGGDGGDGGDDLPELEVKNSADFAYNANPKNVLNSWKERYKGMGFKFEKSVSGATVTIIADGGKKHIAKLASFRGNRNDQARALNKFIEENKI